jgi:ankyrin repeat protein
MAAAQGGHLAILHLLLRACGSAPDVVNALDDDHTSALMLASKNGHAGAIELLLKAGADAHLVNATGASALELAAKRGSEEGVDALLRSVQGVAPSPPGVQGEARPSRAMQVARAAMLAAKHGFPGCVARLMKAGAPVQHLLIRAAAAGDSEQLVVLLKAGAALDGDVASEAMLSASCSGHRGIVQILLNAGASVFGQDRLHGRNALHLAAMHGHAPVVKTLLAAGAAINAADPEGSSALSLAVDKAHKAVVDELLRAGAALERRHMDYETLLGRASDSGIRALLVNERQRRALEAELCASSSTKEGETVVVGATKKVSKKQKKRMTARVARAESAATDAADAHVAADTAADEADEADEAEAELGAQPMAQGRPAEAQPAAASASTPTEGQTRAQEAADEGEEVGIEDEDEEDEEDEDEPTEATAASSTQQQPSPPKLPSTPAAATHAAAAAAAAGAAPADVTSQPASAASSQSSPKPSGDAATSPGKSRRAKAGEKARWLPPSDLVAAGGRVVAPEVEQPSPAQPDEMVEEVKSLKLRFAAEQQCVLREQHITARMWMEKAQAEERAEQSERRIQELERNVKAWEAWHQSQRKQARARRQQALRAAPDELMRMILGELGVQSIQALKPDERHHLAAGLATAVSALLVGKPPPPPGLMRPPPADP